MSEELFKQQQRADLGLKRREAIVTREEHSNRSQAFIGSERLESDRAANQENTTENVFRNVNAALFEGWTKFHETVPKDKLSIDIAGGQTHRQALSERLVTHPELDQVRDSVAGRSRGLRGRGLLSTRGGRASGLSRTRRFTNTLPHFTGPVPAGKSGDVRNHLPRVAPVITSRGLKSRTRIMLRNGTQAEVSAPYDMNATPRIHSGTRSDSNESRTRNESKNVQRRAPAHWIGNLADPQAFMQVAAHTFANTSPTKDDRHAPSKRDFTSESATNESLITSKPSVSASVADLQPNHLVDSRRPSQDSCSDEKDKIFSSTARLVPTGDLLGDLSCQDEYSDKDGYHSHYSSDLAGLEYSTDEPLDIGGRETTGSRASSPSSLEELTATMPDYLDPNRIKEDIQVVRKELESFKEFREMMPESIFQSAVKNFEARLVMLEHNLPSNLRAPGPSKSSDRTKTKLNNQNRGGNTFSRHLKTKEKQTSSTEPVVHAEATDLTARGLSTAKRSPDNGENSHVSHHVSAQYYTGKSQDDLVSENLLVTKPSTSLSTRLAQARDLWQSGLGASIHGISSTIPQQGQDDVLKYGTGIGSHNLPGRHEPCAKTRSKSIPQNSVGTDGKRNKSDLEEVLSCNTSRDTVAQKLPQTGKLIATDEDLSGSMQLLSLESPPKSKRIHIRSEAHYKEPKMYSQEEMFRLRPRFKPSSLNTNQDDRSSPKTNSRGVSESSHTLEKTSQIIPQGQKLFIRGSHTSSLKSLGDNPLPDDPVASNNMKARPPSGTSIQSHRVLQDKGSTQQKVSINEQMTHIHKHFSNPTTEVPTNKEFEAKTSSLQTKNPSQIIRTGIGKPKEGHFSLYERHDIQKGSFMKPENASITKQSEYSETVSIETMQTSTRQPRDMFGNLIRPISQSERETYKSLRVTQSVQQPRDILQVSSNDEVSRSYQPPTSINVSSPKQNLVFERALKSEPQPTHTNPQSDNISSRSIQSKANVGSEAYTKKQLAASKHAKIEQDPGRHTPPSSNQPFERDPEWNDLYKKYELRKGKARPLPAFLSNLQSVGGYDAGAAARAQYLGATSERFELAESTQGRENKKPPSSGSTFEQHIARDSARSGKEHQK